MGQRIFIAVVDGEVECVAPTLQAAVTGYYWENGDDWVCEPIEASRANQTGHQATWRLAQSDYITIEEWELS